MNTNSDNNKEPSVKPFIRLGSDRYRVINKIRDCLPKGNRLIEPFVSSGLVFLNTNYDKFLLSDVNNDLINTFIYLKHKKENFIEFCKQFFTDEFNTKKTYISLRKEFNSTSDSKLKAALFIYLNRHGFNGLIRYNQAGGFNTPFGDYVAPYFPEKEMLGFIKKTKTAAFRCSGYSDVMEEATKGDIVYCDSSYVKKQRRLVEWARELSAKHIPVILSNCDTSLIPDLYKGTRIINVEAQRNINCRRSSRGNVRETLVLFN